MQDNKIIEQMDAEFEFINSAFSYHSPKSDQPERYNHIREAAKMVALVIQEKCPYSQEKLTAYEKLREAVMWANAAIAVNE